MDGFGGRESGGLLEYIKFMAAGNRGCRAREREAAILMLVKMGEETEKMCPHRGRVVPHVCGRDSERFCVRDHVHMTSARRGDSRIA